MAYSLMGLSLGLSQICSADATSSGMKTYCLLEDKLKLDPVATEYQAYCCLKNRPLASDINYIAIPWVLLINSNSINKMSVHKVDGGFTICQHIRFKEIIPMLEKMGITILFTPHVMEGEQFGSVTVLPFPHYSVNGIEPAEHKDVWYSFIGSDTHSTRKQLFQMEHPEGAIVKSRDIWHFASRNKAEEEKEYKDVLARSRYSLCPRGTGASTIRFWESLEAGAIPVMIGDDMMFPQPFDWESCVVIIPIKDMHRIPEILRAISPEKEASMKQKALEAFKKFSGDNFVSTIRYHIDKEMP